MNNDIVSEISEFLETRDTLNVCKLNKEIYRERNRYSIYEVPYEKIEETVYKIRGIRCKILNEKIMRMLNDDKEITHLLCEEECEYDIFIKLEYVTNVRLKKGFINVRDFNKMYSIILPKQIETFIREYQYHNYNYTLRNKYVTKEVIDMTHCNKLKYQEIYLNKTNIILPENFSIIKNNYINIIIDSCGQFDDIYKFENMNMVNRIKYIVKDYVFDNKFEKLELNLIDYPNLKILEIECLEISHIFGYFSGYMNTSIINEFLIDIKHNESIELINIKTWDKFFSYNTKIGQLNEKINKINDNQTNIQKITSFGRKIFHLHNNDYLFIDYT